MELTILVGHFELFQHGGLLEVLDEVVLVDLERNDDVVEGTSPSSSAMALMTFLSSACSFTPYSSHMAWYSAKEMVPSFVTSALSNKSQRAGEGRCMRRG